MFTFLISRPVKSLQLSSLKFVMTPVCSYVLRGMLFHGCLQRVHENLVLEQFGWEVRDWVGVQNQPGHVVQPFKQVRLELLKFVFREIPGKKWNRHESFRDFTLT